VRTDPTDTGGLFIGRRPGTAPVKYRALPSRRGAGRQRADGLLAHGVLGLMAGVNLLFWGPIPMAWLWVASQVEYLTGSVSFGIAVGFAGMLLTLLAGLVVLRTLDHAWILVRRAAGIDQRSGVIGAVFAATAAVGTIAFTAWLLLFAGLGPTLAPNLS
jgi:hypothetical protein